MANVSRLWFLRKENGAIYGPVAEEVLVAWAADGRVAPEDFISADQITWIAPTELPSLCMEWMVEFDNGFEYGPAHEQALLSMIEEGSLELPVRLRNVRTGEVRVIGAEAHKGDTQQLTLDAVPAAEPTAAEPAAAATVAPAEETPAPTAPPTSAAPHPEVGIASGGEPRWAVDATVPAPTAPTTADSAPSASPVPERSLSWQTVARERDFFEKEAARWQALYEQESASRAELQRRYDELERRAEQERLQWDDERDRLRRRVAELEQELAIATERNCAADAQLVEAYHELVHNFELLGAQVVAKDKEIEALRAEVDALRHERDAQWAEIQQSRQREAELLHQTRQRLDELERAHLELLRSYRDLNDRYIRLRAGSPSAGSPGPESSSERDRRDRGSSEAGPDASAGPRVRLWR